MTNELRIGNWVKWKEYILPIKSIDYESVYVELNEELRTIHIDDVPIYASNHIEYAHQLQNLYFALKGEGLTYGGNK